MQSLANSFREKGYKICLVPTMGYFHEAHLSLMRLGKRLCDKLVVSVFVNPIQFGPSEDFERYPRDLERDKNLAREAGVDVLFAPCAQEMYPEGFQTYVEVMELSKPLCGASRPGHFRGVATVVLKLFNIVKPHVAVFGLKDYQQYLVIKRMVKDLNLGIEIVGHPIVREPDGLAMSSRNVYLSSEERRSALCLYKSILRAKELLSRGVRNVNDLKKEIVKLISSYPYTKIDYVEFRDPETLEPVEEVSAPTLLALAVYVGSARLIDNAILGGEENA